MTRANTPRTRRPPPDPAPAATLGSSAQGSEAGVAALVADGADRDGDAVAEGVAGISLEATDADPMTAGIERRLLRLLEGQDVPGRRRRQKPNAKPNRKPWKAEEEAELPRAAAKAPRATTGTGGGASAKPLFRSKTKYPPGSALALLETTPIDDLSDTDWRRLKRELDTIEREAPSTVPPVPSSVVDYLNYFAAHLDVIHYVQGSERYISETMTRGGSPARGGAFFF